MKKIIATLATAIALVILGAAAPVYAHHVVVTHVVTCEEDGTYSILYTYDATDVPDGTEAEVKIIKHEPTGSLLNGVDKQLFLTVWSEHSINEPGVPTLKGDFTTTFTQSGIPGNATQALIQTQGDWKSGWSDNDPTIRVTLDGKCEPKEEEPPPPPVIPEPTHREEPFSTEPTCENKTVTEGVRYYETTYALVDGEIVGTEREVRATSSNRAATPEELGKLNCGVPPTLPPEEPPVTPEEPATPEKPEESTLKGNLAYTGMEEDGIATAILSMLGLFVVGGGALAGTIIYRRRHQ